MRKIYINTDKTFETVSDLLELLYYRENNYQEYLYPLETYEDPEFEDVQCPANKIRSFDDLHDLILTYFPNLKLKDIVHEIVTFKSSFRLEDDEESSGKNYVFYPASCGDIQLITVYYYYRHSNSYGGFDMLAQRNSKYSWEYLLGLLGITTYAELISYINKHHAEKS